MKTTKNNTPTLFSIYTWASNKAGWVHSSYKLGYSVAHIISTNPKYSNKNQYLICQAH